MTPDRTGGVEPDDTLTGTRRPRAEWLTPAHAGEGIVADADISSGRVISPVTLELTTEYSDSLVSLSRTALGDTLRSVVYFTPGEFEVLYLRSDLGMDPVRARSAKLELVGNERLGFSTQETYRDLAEAPGVEPSLGEYLFTVRAFTDGYVARVIVGEQGVLVTTDSMDIDAFEEFAVAARRALEASSG